MKPQLRTTIYFFSGLVLGAVLIFGISLKKIDPSTTSVAVSPEGRPQYKWYAPPVPTKIDFSGEAVPLDRWDVKEKLDREVLVNSYLHGSQLYILKLAGR